MLCLNYLNKTVELLFILYNFAIVPSVGTGIKTCLNPLRIVRICNRTLRGYGD